MDSEPVDQFGVTGPITLGAEFLGGSYDANSEESLPLAVNRHAGSKGMILAGQPTCQAKSVHWRLLGHGRKECRCARSNFLPFLVVLAAVKQMGFAQTGHVLHDHGGDPLTLQSFYLS